METNVYNNYLHYFLNAFANNEKIYFKVNFAKFAFSIEIIIWLCYNNIIKGGWS